jgi:hypothetical protein
VSSPNNWQLCLSQTTRHKFEGGLLTPFKSRPRVYSCFLNRAPIGLRSADTVDSGRHFLCFKLEGKLTALVGLFTVDGEWSGFLATR